LFTEILLVDDHALFREGISLLLRNEFPDCRVHHAGSLVDAASLLAREPRVSLVLLDLALPDSAGLAGLVRLRALTPQPRYVVMSSSESLDLVESSIENGAAGFVPKTSQAGAMMRALRIVLDGGIYLPAHSHPTSATSANVDEALDLSPRQADVLRLLIEAKSTKIISRELSISEATVKTHLAVIYRKLGATSRTQAVVTVARMGLRFDAPPAANEAMRPARRAGEPD
jgi:DNA-binding NarL/FixJ family response regulator